MFPVSHVFLRWRGTKSIEKLDGAMVGFSFLLDPPLGPKYAHVYLRMSGCA